MAVGDRVQAKKYQLLRVAAADAAVRHEREIAAHLEASATHPATARGCRMCGHTVDAAHACRQVLALTDVQELSARWRDGWSASERSAFDTYGGLAHYEINRKLRSGEPLNEEEAATVEGLDSALARAPRTEEPVTLYRGIGLSPARGDAHAPAWAAARFPVGGRVTLEAFTSATPDHSVGLYFTEANSEVVTSGVLLEVQTRHASYTGESPEHEVLLPRGVVVEVVGWENTMINGKPYVKVSACEVQH